MPKSKFYFLSGRKFLIRSSFVRAATRLYHCRIFYGKCSPAEGKRFSCWRILTNDRRLVKLKCWRGGTCFLLKRNQNSQSWRILGASESCLFMFAMPWPPSFDLWRKIGESRNINPWGRHKGEKRRRGRGRGEAPSPSSPHWLAPTPRFFTVTCA